MHDENLNKNFHIFFPMFASLAGQYECDAFAKKCTAIESRQK